MSSDTNTWREKMPAIFGQCVATETTRYSIQHPFVDRDRVWATDGCILVGSPASFAPPDLPRDAAAKFPPVRDVLFGEFATEPLPVVDLGKPPEPETCDSCGGFGLCNQCECESEHDCGRCDGTGVAEIVHPRVDFGVVILSEKYVRIIQDAGGRLYANAKGGKTPVKFVCPNGIEGRVMPILKPDAGFGDDIPAIVVEKSKDTTP